MKRRKSILLTSAVVALLVGVSWFSDWHLSLWDWLGQMNRGETSGDQTDGGETNSATLRNFALLPLALLGIGLTLWRISVAAKTLTYTEERDRADRLHGRYADASGRLSSESVSARLGAIYELQELTEQDPEALHVRTMKLLCAFVRFPLPDSRLDEAPEDDPCGVRLRPDVQAAMEVIGSRTPERIQLETDADYTPDLRGSDLVRLELREGNLSEVDMRFSKLWGADLMQIDLSESELQYADFSSPWVVRGEPRPDVTGTPGSMTAKMHAWANNYTRLAAASFAGSWMLCAKFSGVDLQQAVMADANLPDTSFDSANLYAVDFSNSQLLDADLSDTYLTSAKLTGAKLSGTNLSGTDLTGFFNERSTDKYPPEGLTQSQLDQACADLDNPPKLDPDSGLVWHPRPCTT